MCLMLGDVFFFLVLGTLLHDTRTFQETLESYGKVMFLTQVKKVLSEAEISPANFVSS